jgi:hypothetical protein
MSFKAQLIVEEQTYEVNRFSWSIDQNTDALSRPDARVQGGQLYVELDSQPDDLLHHWALDNTKKLEGKLMVFESDSMSVRKTIEFRDAFCVGLRKSFDGSASTSNMTMSLTLSADKLVCGEVTIDNEWPV